jgi:hypothetical protein
MPDVPRAARSIMTIHIYRVKDQPATCYRVKLGTGVKDIWVRIKPRTLLPCVKCRKKRYARNMKVHVYYDGTYFFCKSGMDCKVPA